MGAQGRKDNQYLTGQRQQNANDFTGVGQDATNRSNTAYQGAQSQIPGLSQGYTNFSNNGGFDPGSFDRLRDTYGTGLGSYGGSGGSSVADELTQTGGIDQSKFDSALKGYSDFASSGGNVDAEGIRARANRAIPQFYQNLQNETDRRRLVNPYGPSNDASSAMMARQAGQQTQENIRDTELGISDLVNKNREFGISGLGDLNSRIQGMVQQGKEAGGQQQISNAGIRQGDEQIRQGALNRAFQGESGILDRTQAGKQFGLTGIRDLYQSQSDNAAGYNNQRLQSYQGRASSDIGYTGARPKSIWDRLTQLGQAGATSAGASA